MIITWSDTTLRYPELAKLPDVSTPSTLAFIAMSEAVVTSRLAGQFTPPFSSNNLTVADLLIDNIYITTQMTRQPEKANALKDYYEERIKSLLAGDSMMMTSSGEIAGTIAGDLAWSSTEDYHPTFGMGDIMMMQVCSEQLIDEDNARGHYPGEAR